MDLEEGEGIAGEPLSGPRLGSSGDTLPRSVSYGGQAVEQELVDMSLQ